MPTSLKTPVHLYVVGVASLLWNAGGAFDYFMTQTKNEEYMANFTAEQLDLFYSLPSWVVACWALAVWGGVLGALLLLLKRKVAAPVFLLSFVSMMATTIHNFGFSDAADILGPTGLAFSAVIWLWALGLVVYSRKMAAKGVLR